MLNEDNLFAAYPIAWQAMLGIEFKQPQWRRWRANPDETPYRLSLSRLQSFLKYARLRLLHMH